MNVPNPSMPITVTIRSLSPVDDIAALTDLIHSAYAKRAAKNLRYWATHQSIEDTAKRFSAGHGLIAEVETGIVGTLIVRPPQPESKVEQFREPTTWTLSQFAVMPQFQGLGIGSRLHEAALAYVWANGGRIMALDTAVPAVDLIEMYRRWGYEVVGECDWRPHTNYLSVVMCRPIFHGVATTDAR